MTKENYPFKIGSTVISSNLSSEVSFISINYTIYQGSMIKNAFQKNLLHLMAVKRVDLLSDRPKSTLRAI